MIEKRKNILIDIAHPAHVHFFKYIYSELNSNHNVMVTARSKEMTFELLNKYNMPFTIISSPRSYFLGKIIEFLEHQINIFKFIKKNDIDLVLSIGASLNAHASKIARIPIYGFTDTEHAKFQHLITKPFATKIFTPDCFLDDLGPKQVRYPGYHELAYLHPNRFTPNPEVLKEIGLNENDKFFIIRFVSWEASHDIGQKGLSLEDKRKLINYLKQHGKIIISAEKELPAEFDEFRMSICPTKMHDLLYYATMYLGEGGTMASEAACLGTYSIYTNPLEMCYTNEERDKYKLIFQSVNIDEIINHILTINLNKIKAESKNKSKEIINDKIDVTNYLIELIKKSKND